MNSNLNPNQFGEPFRGEDEPFTYMPDKRRPKSAKVESLEPFDPYEDSDVDPMSRRVN